MNRTIRLITGIGILLCSVFMGLQTAGAKERPAWSREVDAAADAQGGIVLKGTVISSSDNLPLPGVAVYVKGNTAIGTASDLDGQYSLTVPEGTKTVVFEFLGFDQKEIAVQDYLLFTLVTLVEQSHLLDEVVVVGFGTQKKETLVGAIQAVNPGNLITTSSVLSTSYAGNIAGMIAYQTSGEGGYDGATVNIRGISTFGTNSNPLYIIDGVEVNSQMVNMLASESIETFSVLKDATATALYGSRGANGVIIITTKEGRNSEKMKVSVTLENKFVMPTYIQKVADGATYMEMYNEAVYNESKISGVPYAPYYSQTQIDNTRNHVNKYIYPDNDWYGMLFKNLALNQRANVNVRGGSKNVSYFLNASFYNEGSFVKKPSNYPIDIHENTKTYSIQSNVTANLTSSTTVSVKMNVQLMDKYIPYTYPNDLYEFCMTADNSRFPATWPAEEGDTYVRFGNAVGISGQSTSTNPYARLCQGYNKYFRSYLTGAMSVDQNFDFFTKGLNASVLVSFYDSESSNMHRNINPYYFTLNDDWYIDGNGEYHFTTSSIGDAGNTYLSSGVNKTGYHIWAFQGKVNYARTFGKHDVAADVVFHMRSQIYNAYSSSEDYLLPYRQEGLAARVTYNYDYRYFIEGDFGYNGSENFAPGKRWGFFPSVAIGWNIANEPFMASVHDKLNTMKIRASYGQSGNDELGTRFPYISEINTGSRTAQFGSNFANSGAGYISVYGNEDATWEVSDKFNVGFDLEIFRSLSLSADYFYEYRYNIFMQRSSLPSYVGVSGTTPFANLGECDNRGVDLSLEYNKQFKKDLILQLRGTFTYAHSRVLAMDEPAYENSPNMSKIGAPINSFQVMVAEGIFTSQEEVDNSPVQDFGQYGIGDLKYKDVNGDGVVDSSDKIWSRQTSTPEIVYGFGGTLRYAHWDFTLMFQGTANYWLRIYDADPLISSTAAKGRSIMQWIVDDHWSYDNNVSDASYPRLQREFLANNYQPSTWFLRNAAFLRLKTAEVGYTYRFLRAYVSGSNLFVLSPFKLWDPEKGSGNGLSYPLNRTVSVGIQFNF